MFLTLAQLRYGRLFAKQAGREWAQLFSGFLIEWGFVHSSSSKTRNTQGALPATVTAQSPKLPQCQETLIDYVNRT